MRDILATVIICSYNYGRFLKEAIDSALDQTHRHTEVIVVDDGSRDNSPQIISSYGQRIIPLLKKNEGHDSAVNAGFALSRGEVIIFLDSDDALLPAAVQKAVKLLRDPQVVKVHWPLWEVDRAGRKTGKVIPSQPLPRGDLREVVRRRGPQGYVYSPTSGNAWARRFLERVCPITEMELKAGTADDQLSMLAPLFGRVKRIAVPQSLYRVHDGNNYWGQTAEQLAISLRVYDHQCRVLSKYCRQLGLKDDPGAWRKNSWLHQVAAAARDIERVVPPGGSFILADEDQWGTGHFLAGRRRFAFPERDGEYGGRPGSATAAIHEVKRLRRAGAGFMVFAWPAFWWLDYYAGLRHYLKAEFPCLLHDERLMVFDLRPARRSPAPVIGPALTFPQQRARVGAAMQRRTSSTKIPRTRRMPRHAAL